MSDERKHIRLRTGEVVFLAEKEEGPRGSGWGTFDPDKPMDVDTENPFAGTHTTCPYCNEPVERGILNMANHICKHDD